MIDKAKGFGNFVWNMLKFVVFCLVPVVVIPFIYLKLNLIIEDQKVLIFSLLGSGMIYYSIVYIKNIKKESNYSVGGVSNAKDIGGSNRSMQGFGMERRGRSVQLPETANE